MVIKTIPKKTVLACSHEFISTGAPSFFPLKAFTFFDLRKKWPITNIEKTDRIKLIK